MTWESVVVTVGIALIAAIPGIWGVYNQRRKDANDAEIASKKANSDITSETHRAAIEQIRSLSEQLRDTRAEIRELRKEKDALEDENDRLRKGKEK